ncbi:MAG TPA: hypothetical protein VGI81_07195 [Tepidisphaeraceae bacterium]|jgi:prepilin-type processing-associated H-X9-DG protein
MRAHCFLAGIAALLFVANTSIAQQTDDAVAPFVDAQTLVVTRVELGRVDPNGALGWLIERVKEQGLDQASCDMLRRWWKPSFDKWGGLMMEARDAGVKRAYWLLTLPDILDRHEPRGVWVFPLEGSRGAQKVIDSLRACRLEAQRVGNAVVGSRPGRGVSQVSSASLPPAWAQALAAGQETIRIVVIPTQVLRKSFEENLPSLPVAKGPVPITTLSRGIEWIGLSAELPPNPNVRMVIQAPDAPAAQAIARLAAQALPDVRAEQEQLLPPLRVAAGLSEAQAPTTAGDQVRWAPDFRKAVMPVIMREIVQVARQQSAANMRQIMQGFIMYANNHNGQIPPDLEVLIKEMDMSPQVLVDPLNPKETVGYIYIRPMGDLQKVPPDVAVLYESTSTGRNVAFADGHVEWMGSRQEVQQLVNAAEARNRAAGEGKK